MKIKKPGFKVSSGRHEANTTIAVEQTPRPPKSKKWLAWAGDERGGGSRTLCPEE